ncbi:glycine zipper domain-containing protein [Ruminococcus sp.]
MIFFTFVTSSGASVGACVGASVGAMVGACVGRNSPEGNWLITPAR